MPKLTARSRWITIGITSGTVAALFALVALTGLGLYVTSTQLTQLEKVLVEAALSQARGQILPEVNRRLSRDIDRGLEALRSAARGLSGGSGAPATLSISTMDPHAVIESPFVLTGDFEIIHPPSSPRSETDDIVRDERPPDDYRRAAELLWRHAPEPAVLASFHRVHQSATTPTRWRISALAGIAALHARRGRAPEAIEAYERIFSDYGDELASINAPSYLQLTLAHLEVLLGANRLEESLEILGQVLRLLQSEDTPVSNVAEREFFVTRATELLDRIPAGRIGPVRAALEREDVRIEQQRFAEVLRGWIISRLRVLVASGESSASERRFRESVSGRTYIIVWDSLASTPGSTDSLVVGFSVAPGYLWNLVEAVCHDCRDDKVDAKRGASPLQFHPLPSEWETEGTPTLALFHPLDFLRVSVDESSWQAFLQDGRRPLKIARVLIPVLALGMGAALIMFLRAYRRAVMLSRLKTDFVANVSHELKTPLALIRLFGETLSLERVPDERRKREYYQIITRESERLTHLINNVLDFASIEAGRKSYDLRSTDLGEVVTETLKSYQFQIEQQGFRLHREIEADLPNSLADANAIAQALINLIQNALKYSTERRDICVRVRRRGKDIGIEVQDFGVGIPVEDQPRVFEGFYRSKIAQRLGRRGSGLGLALVQHIVQCHGGRVELDSRPGQGSTFTLVLPARGDESSDPPVADITDENHNSGCRGESDDES